MKCYFHNNVDAVAVCTDCHKSLCKECYDLGQMGRCLSCDSTRQFEENNQLIVDEISLHKRYVRNSIISFFIGAFVGFSFVSISLSANTDNTLNEKIVSSLAFTLIIGYSFFSIYSGLNVLNKIFRKILDMGFVLFFAWPALMVIVGLAACIGVYTSIPMLISHLRKYSKVKKLYKPYSA